MGMKSTETHTHTLFLDNTYCSLVPQGNAVFFLCSVFQNGNWADNLCDDRHGFICMKRSAADPFDDEIEQNIGCKIVRFFLIQLFYSKVRNIVK